MDYAHIQGLDGLLKRMRALPPEIISKNGGAVSKALGAGARLIREQAKANVRAIVAEPNKGGNDNLSTGALEKNIVATRARRPKAINPLASEVWRVRIRRNAKRYADTKFNRRKGKVGATYYNEISYYGRFLEFGTVKLRARAWLRNAAAAKQSEAMQVIAKELAKGIAAAEKKVQSLK